MFILGVNQFIRNYKRNLIATIQVILVYIVAIFTISSSIEQLSLWKGVKDYLDETGVVLWTRNFNYDTDISELLLKVEKVNKKYCYDFDDGNSNHYYLVATNPEENCYQVPLVKGGWCESGNQEDGVIRAVVSNEFQPDCDIGDLIKVGEVTLKITGIYDNNELVFKDATHSSNISYLDFYSCEDISQGFYVLASYEDMFREVKPYSSQSIIIDYEDDITKEQMETNREILNQQYKYIEGMNMHTTDEIYEYSMELLQIKLIPMILVFIVALMFAVISVTASGVITVYAEQRNYGIYFVYGNSWRKTTILSIVHWGMVAIVSLLVAICISVIINGTDVARLFALKFSVHHIWMLSGITLLLILMSVILPFRILNKMQPINIIRNNM